jgi:hypothetical protein
MRDYWCKFLDMGGHVTGAEQIKATDDEAAIAKARVIFDSGLITRYEIWNGQRLIHRETRRRGSAYR